MQDNRHSYHHYKTLQHIKSVARVSDWLDDFPSPKRGVIENTISKEDGRLENGHSSKDEGVPSSDYQRKETYHGSKDDRFKDYADIGPQDHTSCDKTTVACCPGCVVLTRVVEGLSNKVKFLEDCNLVLENRLLALEYHRRQVEEKVTNVVPETKSSHTIVPEALKRADEIKPSVTPSNSSLEIESPTIEMQRVTPILEQSEIQTKKHETHKKETHKMETGKKETHKKACINRASTTAEIVKSWLPERCVCTISIKTRLPLDLTDELISSIIKNVIGKYQANIKTINKPCQFYAGDASSTLEVSFLVYMGLMEHEERKMCIETLTSICQKSDLLTSLVQTRVLSRVEYPPEFCSVEFAMNLEYQGEFGDIVKSQDMKKSFQRQTSQVAVADVNWPPLTENFINFDDVAPVVSSQHVKQNYEKQYRSPHPIAREKTESKLTPQPTESKLTPQTTESKLTPQPTESKLSPQTTESKLSPQPTESKLSPQPTKSKLTPQPTESKLSPQPTESKLSPQPTESKLSPQPIASKLSPQPTESKLSPQPIACKLSPQPTESKLTPQTTESKLSPQPTESKLSPQPTESKLSPQPTESKLTPQPTESKLSPQPTESKITTERNPTTEPIESKLTIETDDVSAQKSADTPHIEHNVIKTKTSGIMIASDLPLVMDTPIQSHARRDNRAKLLESITEY